MKTQVINPERTTLLSVLVMTENNCPKCGKKMTSTTAEKTYCMKCDILIHAPSGVAYTGNVDEDKFIGSPAVWFGDKKRNVEATAALDSLMLTWKEGKTFAQRRIPYAAITSVEFGTRKESEGVSLEAAITGAIVGGGLLLSIGAAGMSEFGQVRTLVVRLREGDYELYVSQPSDWADRLRGQMVATALGQPLETDRSK